jgi:hypothetical protein
MSKRCSVTLNHGLAAPLLSAGGNGAGFQIDRKGVLSKHHAVPRRSVHGGELIAYVTLRFTAEDFPRFSSISNSIC